MFGDSPSDYMSKAELTEQRKKWDREDKLRKARAKKHALRNLSHFTEAELRAELRRRKKGINYKEQDIKVTVKLLL